jgi:hypothetical protein
MARTRRVTPRDFTFLEVDRVKIYFKVDYFDAELKEH